MSEFKRGYHYFGKVVAHHSTVDSDDNFRPSCAVTVKVHRPGAVRATPPGEFHCDAHIDFDVDPSELDLFPLGSKVNIEIAPFNA